MGFEYKILVDLTPQQSLELQYLILEHPHFRRKPYQENDFFEFRHPDHDNPDWMPNLKLLFEHDGIYICRYDHPELWRNLQLIQTYLQQHALVFTEVDYSE